MSEGTSKNLFHRYLPGGLLFLVKKYCEIKYGFEDSVLNVALSSAVNQPIDVKLCETLVLLNHSNNITRN